MSGCDGPVSDPSSLNGSRTERHTSPMRATTRPKRKKKKRSDCGSFFPFWNVLSQRYPMLSVGNDLQMVDFDEFCIAILYSLLMFTVLVGYCIHMNPQLPQDTPAESAPAAEASTEPEDAKSEVGVGRCRWRCCYWGSSSHHLSPSVGITDGMNDHFELVLWTPKLKP